ncbi:hypothetical protein FNF27_03192 [Cafeteria roenbergensis]|uniref:Calmodulin n=1 Tax=Cafeteria roenbergensis TaxID=33653 RepID=A0A5A8DHG1_CAFRO|nr:hypothetical protein FNF29_04338 [Cafeteria roenbergensis]KAA0164688.1 hypothetical protein FNF31_02226 [Cafeteria roenbergensis]KAA0169166.1 hypothetical protein FNF28_02292 [Cafeteria roenbergensis]KAA0175184.1 hypothetical protein FNF27_03192 [Cafeteria roenbergensis]|eukprot:KAA0151932.1 hypothetical protein FNF29_04338 [Cafeteria roenbergensis]
MASTSPIDENLRAQLTSEQREQFTATFRELDADGSGKIDTGEVKNGLEKVGMTVTDKEVTELVQRFDVNGDGELDLQEWLELAAIMFLGKGGRELTNETFNRLDTEKKGFITADDLSTFCTALGKTMEVEFEEMIAACKPETEGRLTKAEFGKLFSAMFPDVGKKSRSKKGPGRR